MNYLLKHLAENFEQPINEFGPMAGSNNREYKDNELVDRVAEIESIIWRGKNNDLRNEWDNYSDPLLGDGDEDDPEYGMWSSLDDGELRDAIEYGEELLRKYELDEMSSTGAGEAYNTPNAFAAPGKKKKRKSLQTYKELDEGIIQDTVEKLKAAPAGTIITGGGFKWIKSKNGSFSTDDNKLGQATAVARQVSEFDDFQMITPDDEIIEHFYKKIEAQIESLNELTYNDYRADESMTSKSKINTGIKEISKQLYEMDKSLNRISKLKTEIGADQSVFLKSTMTKFSKISERLLRLSNKIREVSK